MAKSKFQDHQFAIILGITQVVFLILYGFFTEFHPDAQPRTSRAVSAVPPNLKYPLVIDTHAAIFAGFGFLVVFLRRYGFGGIALNLLLGAFTVEWALLVRGFFARSFERFPIGVTEIVWADFSAAVVLISFGVLVGKLTPVQYLLLALIETVVSVATEFLILRVLHVTDIGGAIVVHLFGAFFGLAASRVLFKAQWNQSEHFGSVYHSDLFSFIGTFFLWIFWPSFNAFHASTEESRNRAVLNTILGLVGSTIFAFFISIVLNPHRRFNIKHVVNASLAGGVAIAAVADVILDPVGALVVGVLAGIVSVLGFVFINPLLLGKLNFHDSRSVLSLHGLPALVGAISSFFFIIIYKKESYGDRTTNVVFPEVASGNREPLEQGLMQLAGIGLALLISIVAGAITGFILRLPIWNQVREKEYFSDLDYFDVPEDFDFSTRVTSHIERVELTEERVRLTGE